MDKSKFLRLEILGTADGATPDEGFVTFRAWFKFRRQTYGGQRDSKIPVQTMTEKSRFTKADGRWLYRETAECDYTAHMY